MKNICYVVFIGLLIFGLAACKKKAETPPDAGTSSAITADQAGNSIENLGTYLLQIFQTQQLSSLQAVCVNRRKVAEIQNWVKTSEVFRDWEPQTRQLTVTTLEKMADSLNFMRTEAVFKGQYAMLNKASRDQYHINWTDIRIEDVIRSSNPKNPFFSTIIVHFKSGQSSHSLSVSNAVDYNGKWVLVAPVKVELDTAIRLTAPQKN